MIRSHSLCWTPWGASLGFSGALLLAGCSSESPESSTNSDTSGAGAVEGTSGGTGAVGSSPASPSGSGGRGASPPGGEAGGNSSTIGSGGGATTGVGGAASTGGTSSFGGDFGFGDTPTDTPSVGGQPSVPGSQEPPTDTSPPSEIEPNYVAAELLGRPTATSVAVNVVLGDDAEAYFEFGTQSGNYPMRTNLIEGEAGMPMEAVMDGLTPNARHYYRLRYRTGQGASGFAAGPERTFHTQRARGETFTFVVQADPHLDDKSVDAVYLQTLANELADEPDFLVDLGDVSMVDKCVIVGNEVCHVPYGEAKTYAEVDARNLLHRASFAEISHSVPIFLTLGNHEGEAGWRMKGDVDTYPYWDVISRKLYYLNPVPDLFYRGSRQVDPQVGLRENYYAWEWGDALFVVIDDYGYGKGGSAWGFSLGDEQYAWFKKTMEASTASHKFIFTHQLIGGGLPGEPGASAGRGGKMFADYFEWGGKNADGTDGFAEQRPGYEMPLREIMESNGASIVFHGHDHLYAKEDVNDMVYLEVPQPSHPTTSTTANLAEAYGYGDAVSYSASGHVRVTVSPEETQVQYVRSYQPSAQNSARVNGTVMHTFSVPAR